MNDERSHRSDLIDVMEARREHADRFAWAVPAVVVASQAFLVTIALDGDADPTRRLIASGAALATLLGAVHLFWKQAFHFALYEAVIKRERKRLGLPLVDRDSLLAQADTLEERFHNEWLERRGGKLVRTVGPGGYFQPRRTIRVRAVRVWLWLFGGLALLDLALAVWAAWDGFDTGWFADTDRSDNG